MTLQFYTPDTLPTDIRLELYEHGVDLDDWDYLILAPHNAIEWRKKEKSFETATYDRTELSRLLTGCFKNVWYRTPTWSVGVAYHS